MNYALWADRVLAALIDGGIALVVMLALYVLLFIVGGVGTALISAGEGAMSNGGDAPFAGLFGCTTCCLFFLLPPLSYFVAGIYNKVYLVSKRGYSVGHGIMKLKVVDAQWNTIALGTAAVRLLATVGMTFIPVVGIFLDVLWPLWDPQRQALHDKAVGTFVIKTNDH